MLVAIYNPLELQIINIRVLTPEEVFKHLLQELMMLNTLASVKYSTRVIYSE